MVLQASASTDRPFKAALYLRSIGVVVRAGVPVLTDVAGVAVVVVAVTGSGNRHLERSVSNMLQSKLRMSPFP